MQTSLVQQALAHGTKWEYPGTYCMNSNETNPTDKRNAHKLAYKIGASWGDQGVCNRQDHCNSYFPHGWNLWHICLTESGEQARALETAVKNRLNQTEGVTLPQCENNIRPPRDAEWFSGISIEDLESIVQQEAVRVCGRGRHLFVDHTKTEDYGPVFRDWGVRYSAMARERQRRESLVTTRGERTLKKERAEKRERDQYSKRQGMPEPYCMRIKVARL